MFHFVKLRKREAKLFLTRFLDSFREQTAVCRGAQTFSFQVVVVATAAVVVDHEARGVLIGGAAHRGTEGLGLPPDGGRPPRRVPLGVGGVPPQHRAPAVRAAGQVLLPLPQRAQEEGAALPGRHQGAGQKSRDATRDHQQVRFYGCYRFC